LFFKLLVLKTMGRCYDHNFGQVSPIFFDKNGVLLKNPIESKPPIFFAHFFGE
jgi:hypothetical protein